uniref:YfiR family protein n=1 Tax=Geoalkalibacter sp. TaxID=3041440 RepID=UPI00272E88B7
GMHRPTRLLLFALLGLICSLSLCAPSSAKAQPPAALEEYEAKAAFLFNFAKFVLWPQPTRTEEPLRIGILGANPFGATIHHLEESSIGGRPVRVVFPENRDEIRACQVLFISRSEAPRLTRRLADLEGFPVLTVSDLDGFTEAGGMIGLLLHNNRIRFEINLAAAQQAGLSFSSKLLSLAINAEELGRERQP